jgi:uncharacterized coiled-coil protein SlyX
MGTFTDLVAPVWQLWALRIKIAIAVVVVLYIGYLNWQASSYKTTIEGLNKSLAECQSQTEKLGSRLRDKQDELTTLNIYYQNRKCLDLKGGELSDEEMNFK